MTSEPWDDPFAYEGCEIRVHGAKYQVDPQINVGGEKVVYGLTNTQSGRQNLVFKVFASRALSEGFRGRLRALSRKRMLLPEPDSVRFTPTITIRHESGSVQIQSRLDDTGEQADPIGELMAAAARHVDTDAERAIGLYEQVLERNPFYDLALHNIGALLVQLGAKREAVEYLCSACEVEPCVPKYLESASILALDLGLPSTCLWLARRQATLFDHFDPQADRRAVFAFVAANRPDLARQLATDRLESVGLDSLSDLSLLPEPAPVRMYYGLVDYAESAIQRKAQAFALMDESFRQDADRSRELLEEALGIWSADADVWANHAVALRNAGQFEPAQMAFLRSAQLSSSLGSERVADAAFVAIVRGDHRLGLELMHEALSGLGGLEAVRSADLPCVGESYLRGAVRSWDWSSTAQLLADQTPGEGSVHRASYLRLVARYRQAAGDLL